MGVRTQQIVLVGIKVENEKYLEILLEEVDYSINPELISRNGLKTISGMDGVTHIGLVLSTSDGTYSADEAPLDAVVEDSELSERVDTVTNALKILHGDMYTRFGKEYIPFGDAENTALHIFTNYN